MKNEAKENDRTAINAERQELVEKLQKMELQKTVAADLHAAIHFLTVMRDTPRIYEAVVAELEKTREKAIQDLVQDQIQFE